MKRILFFLVMFGILGMIGVMGDNLPTTISVQQQEIVFSVGPASLDFPNVVAGGTSTATTPITFSVTSGNVDVTFTASSTSGDSLFSKIEVRDTGSLDAFTSVIGKSVNVPCVVVSELCTYPSTISWDAQLPVPAGTKAGARTGSVVYTVTGPTP